MANTSKQINPLRKAHNHHLISGSGKPNTTSQTDAKPMNSRRRNRQTGETTT